jgi:hypothetical protein
MNVAILGASNKPDRYSYQAFRLLREKGHTAFPVHPVLADLEGVPVYPSLARVAAPLDTITIYLSANNQKAVETDILASSARRVIFNPGAENPELAARLRQAGKETLEACTLVLLKTGQF